MLIHCDTILFLQFFGGIFLFLLGFKQTCSASRCWVCPDFPFLKDLIWWGNEEGYHQVVIHTTGLFVAPSFNLIPRQNTDSGLLGGTHIALWLGGRACLRYSVLDWLYLLNAFSTCFQVYLKPKSFCFVLHNIGKVWHPWQAFIVVCFHWGDSSSFCPSNHCSRD